MKKKDGQIKLLLVHLISNKEITHHLDPQYFHVAYRVTIIHSTNEIQVFRFRFWAIRGLFICVPFLLLLFSISPLCLNIFLNSLSTQPARTCALFKMEISSWKRQTRISCLLRLLLNGFKKALELKLH